MNSKSIRDVFSLYEKISTIIIWLTGLSTMVWLGTEVFHVLSPNMTINISWGTDRTVAGVMGLFFQCQRDSTFGFGTFYRNSGIFCEAPMFSLVANLALIYELFLSGQFRKNRIFVLCVGILSSFTSTGVVMLGVCLALLYWKQIRDKRTRIRVMYIMGLIVVIPLALYWARQLFEAKSVTGSYTVRMIDYVIGFRAFLRNPITGTGFNNLSNLITDKASLLLQFGLRGNDTGFSNSISAVLGQGGIYLFILYLFPFIAAFRKKIDYLDVDYTLWCVAFLMLFIIVIFYARCIMIYFLAMGYTIVFSPNIRKGSI